MNECERGSLCSRVKPCGIISLSKAGLGAGPVASTFSLRAVFSKFILNIDWNWFWWQPPQTAGSVLVTGRAFVSLRWLSVPLWHDAQASPLCLPASWNALIGWWHARQAELSVPAGAEVFLAWAQAAPVPALSAMTAATRAAPAKCEMLRVAICDMNPSPGCFVCRKHFISGGAGGGGRTRAAV